MCCFEAIDEQEAKRRVGHASPSNAAVGPEVDREAKRPPWAALIRWVVVGAFVVSVSVWVVNVTQPPPLGDEAIQAPTPNPSASASNAAVPGRRDRDGTPKANENAARCKNCLEKADVPVGRLTKEAEPLSSVGSNSLEPKEMFKDCSKCPEMIVVPAGRFTMGSPDSEQGHNPDERPQQTVTFSLPFAVGRFAVTFEEWDTCVAEGGCNEYMPPDQGWGRGRRPVTNGSWNDAKAYVVWVSLKTGRRYRLLSEAEREYVARAGTTLDRPSEMMANSAMATAHQASFGARRLRSTHSCPIHGASTRSTGTCMTGSRTAMEAICCPKETVTPRHSHALFLANLWRRQPTTCWGRHHRSDVDVPGSHDGCGAATRSWGAVRRRSRAFRRNAGNDNAGSDRQDDVWWRGGAVDPSSCPGSSMGHRHATPPTCGS
jgi:Sulfatase-modifying factor enzyme 1